ncbi:MAG: SEC-C metal-binding domain-containing protein [Vicinamibacterales bacterium]
MTHPPPSRNDPCPCGSGRKYKRCCMEREQSLRVADGWLRLVDGSHSTAPRIFDPSL